MPDPSNTTSHRGWPKGKPIGPDTHVRGNVPCQRCGYNLRGLEVHGLCPECSAPVDEALGAMRPEAQYRRDWLIGVRKGAVRMAIAYAVVSLCLSAEYWGRAARPLVVPVLVLCNPLTYMVIVWSGAYAFTAPCPTPGRLSRRSLAGQICFFSAWMFPLLVVVMALLIDRARILLPLFFIHPLSTVVVAREHFRCHGYSRSAAAGLIVASSVCAACLWTQFARSDGLGFWAASLALVSLYTTRLATFGPKPALLAPRSS